MNEITFDQLCQTTGKTDAELGELAGVKASTVATYRKTNKPSQSLRDAVASILSGEPVKQPSMGVIAVDRELIPTDFTDNEDWHYVRIQDSGPGGTERVRADAAQYKAGITQKGPHGKDVYCRYDEAHRFSDNFVIMKCPMSQYLSLESAAQAHAASQWPETTKTTGDGISTKTERETRFIEGGKLPTGEPIAA